MKQKLQSVGFLTLFFTAIVGFLWYLSPHLVKEEELVLLTPTEPVDSYIYLQTQLLSEPTEAVAPFGLLVNQLQLTIKEQQTRTFAQSSYHLKANKQSWNGWNYEDAVKRFVRVPTSDYTFIETPRNSKSHFALNPLLLRIHHQLNNEPTKVTTLAKKDGDKQQTYHTRFYEIPTSFLSTPMEAWEETYLMGLPFGYFYEDFLQYTSLIYGSSPAREGMNERLDVEQVGKVGDLFRLLMEHSTVKNAYYTFKESNGVIFEQEINIVYEWKQGEDSFLYSIELIEGLSSFSEDTIMNPIFEKNQLPYDTFVEQRNAMDVFALPAKVSNGEQQTEKASAEARVWLEEQEEKIKSLNEIIQLEEDITIRVPKKEKEEKEEETSEKTNKK